MKRFLFKLALLAAINIAVALAIITFVDARRSFRQWETDSILYVTPKNEAFDFVTLGTSRARIFSEFKGNYDFATRELGMKYLNLAIPFGGGILPEKMFLEYFFDHGNTAKTVVLFLDPFMLFSDAYNLQHRFVFYEPFRPSFLAGLLRNRIPIQQVITYVRSKFGLYWFQRAATVKESDPRVAKHRENDAEMVRKRIASLYPEGLSEKAFERYAKDLAGIMDIAKRHEARLVIISPPTLLGPEPGAPKLAAFLNDCKARYTFEAYDYTNEMQDYAFFADHDHLNSTGFQFFVKTYIEPILRKRNG